MKYIFLHGDMEMKPKIEQWLSTYTNPRVIYQYRSNIKKYFEYIGKDPDTYVDPIQDIKQYEQDFLQYWKDLHDPKRGIGKSRRRGLKNAFKLYLEHNDIELPSRFWKSLKKSAVDRGTRADTLDDYPEPKKLGRILQHADARMKAYILMMSSSGIRPEELCGLTEADIEYPDNPKDPTTISIPKHIAKNKHSRYTFITPEATKALREWMKERPYHIEKNKQKLEALGKPPQTQNDTLFLASRNHMSRLWTYVLNKAGENKRDNNTVTKYHVYHLYTIKKYFRTQLAPEIKGGADIVRALMGHEQYLDAAYERYGIKQLREFYKDAMHSLTTTKSSPQVKELHQEMTQDKQRIKELETELTKLNITVEALINKLSG